MKPKHLARKLVAEPNARGRRKLLLANRGLLDERLARELAELCFELWSSEPTVARRAAQALTTLSKLNSDPIVDAYRYWVAGIAEITRGKLTAAADLLAGHSYAESFVKVAIAACNDLNITSGNAVLLLYDFAYEGSNRKLPVGLTFVGSFPYSKR